MDIHIKERVSCSERAPAHPAGEPEDAEPAAVSEKLPAVTAEVRETVITVMAIISAVTVAVPA